MYKTILVPLDGSKRAEAILPHVEELAWRYDAKVVFLRVSEEPIVLGSDEGVDVSQYQQERVRLEQEAEANCMANSGKKELKLKI